MQKAKRSDQECIYERLAPKECLIISKTKKDALVACNEDGKIVFRRIQIPQNEE